MERESYFSEKRIREIERKIELLLNERGRKIRDPDFIFLDNAALMQLLQISHNTLARWRLTGILPYTQIQNKFFYTLADVAKMMERYKNK